MRGTRVRHCTDKARAREFAEFAEFADSEFAGVVARRPRDRAWREGGGKDAERERERMRRGEGVPRTSWDNV